MLDRVRLRALSPSDDDFLDGELEIDGRIRLGYKHYVPRHAERRRRPLLLMLHGCEQNAQDFAVGTGMNEYARRHGMHVVYPEQTARANRLRCWNWFESSHQRRGQGEPHKLATLVSAIVDAHRIHPERIFVAGLSAGGSMAAILGDAYPDVFAAVGVHSGLASGSARSVHGALAAMRGNRILDPVVERNDDPDHIGAPPTIVFHGSDDAVVDPINGEQVIRCCLARRANGISMGEIRGERLRSHRPAGFPAYRQVHRDIRGRVVCEHWLVDGAGHAWSGGEPAGSYTEPRGPDASREMLRFFLATPRQRALAIAPLATRFLYRQD